MGWRRSTYERERVDKGSERARRVPREFEGSNGTDLEVGNFVFRNHFFENYMERVRDPLASYRTPREIARITVHSLSESSLPERIPRGVNYNVLVMFHIHDRSSGQEIPFSLHYVPVRRDFYNLRSGRICPVTILDAEERLAFICQRKKLWVN